MARVTDDGPTGGARRLAFLREEVRFEITLLHDRVNALIGAEAFLMVAFTMALTSDRADAPFLLVAPVLSLVGLLLAALAWPGTAASFRIVAAWDARQREMMAADPSLREDLWRPEVRGRTGRRDPDQRWSMLFARAVPAVLVGAWTVLTIVALVELAKQ